MVVPTYLLKKQNGALSKHHRIQNQLSSKYVFIKNQVVSKFHGLSQNRPDNIDQSTLDFVARYDLLSDKRDEDENQKIKELMKPLETNSLNSEKKEYPKEKLDWRRIRISGETISIVVKEGLIIEKVFLTPQGNRISIKRHELGLFVNFNLNIFKKFIQGN